MTGEELKEYRKQRGLSQTKMAEELGVSMRTVQNWEGNINSIPLLVEEKIKNSTFNSYSVHNDSLTDEDVKEIVYKVASNEERFMQEKVFSNIIEIRVAKKIATLMSSDEEYKKWRNS